MPQAFSVSTSGSVVPAASAATSAISATPAHGAPDGSTQPQDNAGPIDFLGQLKTALKNLTKAVKPPTVAPEAVPQLAASAQTPANDAPTAVASASADTRDAALSEDHSADVLPDLLAALGFVPVPLAFAPPPVAVSATAPAAAQTAAPAPPVAPIVAAAQLPVAVPLAAPIDLPQDAVAAPQSPAPLDVAQLPQPEAPLPMPEALPQALPQAIAATQAPRTKTPTVAPAPDTSAPTAPIAATAATTPAAAVEAPTQTPGPAITPLQGQPAPHHVSAPPTPAVDTPQVTVVAHQNSSQEGHADDRQQPSAPQAVERIDDTSSAPSTTTVIDSAIAAAAGSTVANATAVLPPQVRPAEVVSQIAHQADLYRLPGNRGVRVQLHPDDLGGVEVTLRYGAGGALQLHINVEHAATGALVQAGWTELRDALATQGISPDRLVMSVTAPSSSNQLDFSGGGSGRQTDQNLTGFAQSQSGQHRQDTPDQAGRRGWNGAVEPTSPSDDTPRVASTSGATSRIDYRA